MILQILSGVQYCINCLRGYFCFQRYKYIKYEAVYGVLKFLNMLTYLPEDDHHIRELCISTLAQSAYDKGALELPVMAADLLMKMQGGLIDLLKRLYDRFEGKTHDL